MGLWSKVKSFFSGSDTSTSTTSSSPTQYQSREDAPSSFTAAPSGESGGTTIQKVSSSGGGGGGGSVLQSTTGVGVPVQSLPSGDVGTSTGKTITQQQSRTILRQIENKKKVERYARNQQSFYERQIQRNIKKIGNFSSLSKAQQDKIIKGEIAKAEKGYKRSVGTFSSSLFIESLPKEAAPFSTPKGYGYSIPDEAKQNQTQSKKGFVGTLLGAEKKAYDFFESNKISKKLSYGNLLGIDTAETRKKALAEAARLESQDRISLKDSSKILLFKSAKYLPETIPGAAFRGVEAVGIFYGGRFVLGRGAAAYGTLPLKVQSAGSVVGTGVEAGFFYYGVKKASDPKDPYRALGVGYAVVSGTSLGIKTLKKVRDVKITLTRTEIPKEDLIPKDVLSGKKLFPESETYGFKNIGFGKVKQEFDIKIFKQKGFGYHAAPDPLKSKTILTRKELIGQGAKSKTLSEFEGLYIAPDVSPHFLKLTGAGEKAKISFFPSVSKPQVLKVTPKGFVKGTSAQEGYAFVPGGKPEIEAIIPSGTNILKQKSDLYFKYKGRVVPIDEYLTSGKGYTSQNQILSREFLSGYSLPKSEVSTSFLFPSVSYSFYSKKGKGSILNQLKSSSKRFEAVAIRPPSYRRKNPPGFSSPPFVPPPGYPSGSGGSSSRSVIPSLGPPPSSPPRKGYSSTGPSIFGRPILPAFLRLKGKKKSSSKLFPQPKKYQPTLAAVALNIKALKVPKAYFRGAGSIIQRPLIPRKRKKKK